MIRSGDAIEMARKVTRLTTAEPNAFASQQANPVNDNIRNQGTDLAKPAGPDLCLFAPSAASQSIRDSTQTKVIFQVDDDNKKPSSGATPEPRSWKERYRWLGVLMMAAFAGLGPAPPPKPPRALSEYSQIAEDPDGLDLDPEFHFLHNEPPRDESRVDA